ncbi:MAG: hypothetical protein H0W04_06615 [Chthoniobacterales bacterium]|nr:hypothetical protein [Chthoniobacterales bacterium]
MAPSKLETQPEIFPGWERFDRAQICAKRGAVGRDLETRQQGPKPFGLRIGLAQKRLFVEAGQLAREIFRGTFDVCGDSFVGEMKIDVAERQIVSEGGPGDAEEEGK